MKVAPPNPNAVAVWTTRTIWDDYVNRQVFPDLNPTSKAGHSAGYDLHWVEPAYAELVLLDAKQRLPTAKGPIITSFSRHVERLGHDIEAAKMRPSWLTSDKPRSLYINKRAQRFLATRKQLFALGAPEGLALPGTPDGPKRKATFKNAAGFTHVVLKADHVWPDTFYVDVSFPEAPKPPKEDDQLVKLLSAPRTRQEFRDSRAKLSCTLAVGLRFMMNGGVGFEYSQEIHREADAIMEQLQRLLLTGQVVGDGRDATERLNHTRSAIQGLAQMTLQGRKQMSGQGAVTESESKLAERAMSGDIEMTATELRTLASAAKRAAQWTYNQHQAQLKNMRGRPDLQGMADFYTTAPFPVNSGPVGDINFEDLK